MSRNRRQPNDPQVAQVAFAAAASVDFILAVDLEATCCNDDSFPRDETEIIEIGAAVVDVANKRVVDTFSTFIRPIIHPNLTAFCTELTTIQQSDVNSAPTLVEAFEAFKEWQAELFPTNRVLWASWGNYDHSMFKRECERHRLAMPLPITHLNMKSVESSISRVPPRGLSKAVAAHGLKWTGTAHRGVDDATNLAALIAKVLL